MALSDIYVYLYLRVSMPLCRQLSQRFPTSGYLFPVVGTFLLLKATGLCNHWRIAEVRVRPQVTKATRSDTLLSWATGSGESQAAQGKDPHNQGLSLFSAAIMLVKTFNWLKVLELISAEGLLAASWLSKRHAGQDAWKKMSKGGLGMGGLVLLLLLMINPLP